MPTNTQTECTQTAALNSKIAKFNQQGVKGKATLNGITTIDLKLTDDNWLTGGKLLVKNAVFGDYCDMQVVDVDNILGYGTNVVLDQFVTSYYLDDTRVTQGEFDVSYTAKLRAGLYVRVVYHSTGGMVQPEAAANFSLHMVLR